MAESREKTMLKLATIVLALAAIAVPASAAVADGLAAPYLHIQVALANDSTDGVGDAARAIAAEAAGMGEQAAAIGAAAEALADATDLQSARDAFGPLSDALIAYGRDVGFGELRLAYCPMVDKEWLQATSEIRNPFYGSMMLTCGEFR
jgi:Cu(I)/Ag(I) efflux system membrane fusion protein